MSINTWYPQNEFERKTWFGHGANTGPAAHRVDYIIMPLAAAGATRACAVDFEKALMVQHMRTPVAKLVDHAPVTLRCKTCNMLPYHIAKRGAKVNIRELTRAANYFGQHAKRDQYCEDLETEFVISEAWVERARMADVTLYDEIRDWLTEREFQYWQPEKRRDRYGQAVKEAVTKKQEARAKLLQDTRAIAMEAEERSGEMRSRRYWEQETSNNKLVTGRWQANGFYVHGDVCVRTSRSKHAEQ